MCGISGHAHELWPVWAPAMPFTWLSLLVAFIRGTRFQMLLPIPYFPLFPRIWLLNRMILSLELNVQADMLNRFDQMLTVPAEFEVGLSITITSGCPAGCNTHPYHHTIHKNKNTHSQRRTPSCNTQSIPLFHQSNPLLSLTSPFHRIIPGRRCGGGAVRRRGGGHRPGDGHGRGREKGMKHRTLFYFKVLVFCFVFLFSSINITNAH